MGIILSKISKDYRYSVESLMEETSGLARHNGGDNDDVHVNIGGDCPDAGTDIPDQFTAADGCTRRKNGVEETCAGRPHEDDTVSGTNSQDQCVTAKRCKRVKDGVQEVNEDRLDGDDSHTGADSPDRCLAAKRHKTSKSNVKEASTSGPHHANLNDETKNGSDHSIAADILSSIDKYRYRPLDSRDKTVVPTKEHRFLNSQIAGGQVSLDSENFLGEEEELCIKCEGSGQLLVCSMCPVVVHHSCLGYEGRFDNMGNFSCPFCSYRCVDAKYKRAKKELESAKNALSIFMKVAEIVPGCQRQADPSIASREEEAIGHASHISPIKGKDVPVKILDKSQCKSGEEHMQAQCGIAYESNVARTTGELTHHVNHQESMESQQKKEALIVNRGDDLLGRESSIVLHETCEVSLSKRRSHNQNVFQEQTSIREAEDEILTKATNGLETNSSPSRDAVIASITQRLVEERNHGKTVLPQVINPSQASVIELNTSGKQNTGDENKGGIILEKSIKPQGATIRSNPTSPNLQRRKRLWTVEEEEMLKEGVQKFSGKVVKNFPWKKILEHGHHVFDESRAPAELKDKWRKMLAKEGAEGPK